MALQALTANRLSDGLVVWLDPAGAWVVEVDRAAVFEDEATVAAALVRAAEDARLRKVVEPYAIDVKREGGSIVPASLRERIRAAGPTVPSDYPDQTTPEKIRLSAGA